MTNQYHATPYDLSATGFYFTNYEDYADKSAKHLNEYGDHVEEYEIQFIDGDNYRLFSALNVNQANMKQWFDDYEELDGDALIKAIFLAEDQHCPMDDLLSKLDDIILFEGTSVEYAENYLEDTGLLEQIPENLRFYFDTESFARDMSLNGDITELNIDGTNYILWGC